MSAVSNALDSRRLTVATAVMLTLLGIAFWLTMSRSEDPAFPDRGGLIVTPFPGADPERIERLVAEPLGEELAQIDQIKDVVTTIRAGVVVTIVVLKDEVYDTKPVWDDVRRAMKTARNEYPQGVLESTLNDEMIDADTATIAVIGPRDLVQLRRAAERLKNKLYSVNNVARIVLSGDPGEQISIAYDDAMATRLGITPRQIATQMKVRNVTLPGGSVVMDGKTTTLLPNTEFSSIQELREQAAIAPSGASLPLESAADIRLTPKFPADALMRINGVPAVGVVVKAQPEDINVVTFGNELRARVEEVREEFAKDGFQLVEVFYQPSYTKTRLAELGSSLLIGVMIVALILFLTMGVRLGATVAVIIPMVSMTTLGIYALGGGELHQMSIAGMVIALGMLVDNAIVMVESIQYRMDHGMSRQQAARESVRELAGPLLAATGTTVAAFLPMILSKGSTADFTFGIPSMIILTIIVSYFYAITVTPAISRSTLKPEPISRSNPNKKNLAERVGGKLGHIATTYPRWVLIFVMVGVISTLVFAKFIRFEFFPSTERTQVVMELNLPEGNHLDSTSEAVRELEYELLKRAETKDVFSFIGESGPRFYYNLFRYPGAPHFARIVVETHSVDDTVSLINWARNWVADKLPDSKFQARRLGQGPPIESPVEIRLFGDDVEQLYLAAEKVFRIIEEAPGTIDASHNLGIGVPSIEYQINDTVAARYGMTRTDVALALLGRSHGIDAGEFRAGDDPTRIVVRSPEGQHFPADELDSVFIYAPNGKKVPLLQIAQPVVTWQPSVIYHRNQRRVVTVSSQLEYGYTFSQVVNAVQDKLQAVDDEFAGISIGYGGEKETSGDANAQLFGSLPPGLTVLLFFLLLQFNSFRRLTIVMMTIPLAAVGIIPGLLLSGQPLGFSSLLGIFALMGIVVNNAIVLIDLIDVGLANGMSLRDSIRESVQRRLRPILLTTVTTIFGLMPLTLSTATLWPPMAWAIISGLIASTILTVLAVPAMCYLMLGNKRNREASA